MRTIWFFILVLAVLLADSLAYHQTQFSIFGFQLDWGQLNWKLEQWRESRSFFRQTLAYFDWFKFIFWFLLPGAIFYRYFWKLNRSITAADLKTLLIGVFISSLIVASISIIPSLSEYYQTVGAATLETRFAYVSAQLAWTISWLLGYELMLRAGLPSAIRCFFDLDKTKIILFALSIGFLDSFYHVIQLKDPVESIGIGIFGFWGASWVLKGRSVWVPILIHASIEFFFIMYLGFF